MLVATLLLLLEPSNAGAAENDARLWTTLQGTYRIGTDWELGGLVQLRFAEDISELERILVNPWITKRIRKLGIGLSLGYDAHLIRNPIDFTENIIWQQVAASHSLWTIGLSHQLRLEERFIDQVSGVAMRVRYSLRATQPIASTPVYGFASNEVFFNLNSRPDGPQAGFDQNRAAIGIGFPIRGRTRLEVGYQLQYLAFASRRNAANHMLTLTLTR